MKELYYPLAFLLVGCTATVFTSHWTDWSPCSVTCGRGYQTRHLSCTQEETLNCTNGTHSRQSCWVSTSCTNNESCSVLSCQNGGTCETVETGSHCVCQEDFTGSSCETTHADASVACPPLTNPLNGWVTVFHGVATIARYGCDVNHVLTPSRSNTRRCKSRRGTSKWDGKSPVCKAIKNNCNNIDCNIRCVYGYLNDSNTGCDICSCYPGCPDDYYGNVTKCNKCSCSSTRYCDKRDGYCSRYNSQDLNYPNETGRYSNESQSGDNLSTAWTESIISSSYPYTQKEHLETANTQPAETASPIATESVQNTTLPIMVIAAASAGATAFLLTALTATFVACHKRKHNDVDMTIDSERKEKYSKPGNPVRVEQSSNINRENETKPVPPPRPPGHEYMTLIPNGGNDIDRSIDRRHNYTSLLPSSQNIRVTANPESATSGMYREIENVMEEKEQLENQPLYMELSEFNHSYTQLENPL